jgi:hypothetical protein
VSSHRFVDFIPVFALLRALRGMIFDFLVFMSLAIICFSGLLYTLFVLGESLFEFFTVE